MPPRPVLRFAPSPNGYLHLGHAFSALMTMAAARSLGGDMLLRIEDIDLARSKPEFVSAIFDDLSWLGIRWDRPPVHQSDRFGRYATAFEALVARGLVYPCFCSRKQVRSAATARDPDGVPLYPGTCRHYPAEVAYRRIAAGQSPAWRLDMRRALDRVALPEINELTFFRLDEGRVELGAPTTRTPQPTYWGDPVIKRKDSPSSYHLSVVVDDAAQGVTHVTRGKDLYHATDLQILLQVLLGLPHPIYAHHDLIRDAEDIKLAKSRGSLSLHSLMEQGRTAAEIRAMVGF